MSLWLCRSLIRRSSPRRLRALPQSLPRPLRAPRRMATWRLIRPNILRMPKIFRRQHAGSTRRSRTRRLRALQQSLPRPLRAPRRMATWRLVRPNILRMPKIFRRQHACSTRRSRTRRLRALPQSLPRPPLAPPPTLPPKPRAPRSSTLTMMDSMRGRAVSTMRRSAFRPSSARRPVSWVC